MMSSFSEKLFFEQQPLDLLNNSLYAVKKLPSWMRHLSYACGFLSFLKIVISRSSALSLPSYAWDEAAAEIDGSRYVVKEKWERKKLDFKLKWLKILKSQSVCEILVAHFLYRMKEFKKRERQSKSKSKSRQLLSVGGWENVQRTLQPFNSAALYNQNVKR